MKLGQNLLFLSIMKSQITNTIIHRLKILSQFNFLQTLTVIQI